jgi:hypothetical protein
MLAAEMQKPDPLGFELCLAMSSVLWIWVWIPKGKKLPFHFQVCG